MNAPMQIPVDIHDNVINNGPQGPAPTMPSQQEWDEMFPTEDPNAEQDIPDSWSEDSVDSGQQNPSYCDLNPGDSACIVSKP